MNLTGMFSPVRTQALNGWMIIGRYRYCDPLTKTISAPLDPTDQCFEVKMQTWGTYNIWGSIQYTGMEANVERKK